MVARRGLQFQISYKMLLIRNKMHVFFCGIYELISDQSTNIFLIIIIIIIITEKHIYNSINISNNRIFHNNNNYIIIDEIIV